MENGFGILGNRYQFLLGTSRQQPDKLVTTVTTVMAACCLYNLMRMRYPAMQNVLNSIIIGAWKEWTHDMKVVTGGHKIAKAVKQQRLYRHWCSALARCHALMKATLKWWRVSYSVGTVFINITCISLNIDYMFFIVFWIQSNECSWKVIVTIHTKFESWNNIHFLLHFITF